MTDWWEDGIAMAAAGYRMMMTHVLQTANSKLQEIQSNLTYIVKELPNVQLPPEMKERLVTSVRLFSEELFWDVAKEIHETMQSVENMSNLTVIDAVKKRQVISTLDLALKTTGDHLVQLHRLIHELANISAQDREYSVASVLVTESATNIINAFNRINELRDGLYNSLNLKCQDDPEP